MRGFRDFILRGNVVDLAVAVVIGAAFTAVVTAFVKDLLTPLIAAMGGQPDFGTLYFTINGSRFAYGDFINAVISFLIVAGVVYFLVVLPVNRLMALRKSTEPEGPRTRECPFCLSKVPVRASRCAFCTSELTPDSGPGEVKR
jgi:large conductance mechanosensitive channel